MNLPEFSIKQPVATMMLFLALALIGIFSFMRLNLDLYPEMEPPVLSVITAWPGASSSDVETEVTEQIESVVNTINDLDTLTSRSLDNLSIVACQFNWGADLDVASSDIRDALELVKRRLPDDAETPIVFRFSSAIMPVLFISIAAEKSWPRLYHLTEKKVSDELKRIPGVGGVMIYGGLRRQINVYFDMEKIAGFRLSLHGINQILAAENLNIPAGSIKVGKKDYFVRIPARFKTIDEVRNTIVGNSNKQPIYLKDVAAVDDDYEPMQLRAYGDGRPSLVMMVQKQSGTNTVEVVNRVKKKLAEITKDLPSDVKINIMTDSSEEIIKSVVNLRSTLFWSIFFIIIVTVVFLREVRTAFIIILIIPFSLMVSFIFIYMFGYTINLVTLMALAVASGLVVDNGIVVLENIIRHVEKGRNVKTSAVFGANEMGLAIAASTMTTVVVFLPLIFVGGIAGIVFRPLGFVVVITLLASLLTALMLTPMLASRWLIPISVKSRAKQGRFKGFYDLTEKGFELIENTYERILNWSLYHSKTVILLAVTVFLSSLSFTPFISTSFFPDRDTGNVSIRFRLEEGTRIEETTKVLERIMEDINELVHPEELRHYYGWVGESKEGMASAVGFDEGPNVGSLSFTLVDKDKRKRSVNDIARILRERFSRVPGITQVGVTTTSSTESALRGGRKPISLEIQGYDLKENLMFARKVKAVMKKIPGLVDVSISQKEPRPEIWVEIDRKKASDLGLNVLSIAGTLRNYFYGADATEYRDSGSSFDIVTRFTEIDKNSLENLKNAPLLTRDGRIIRLNNVARIIEGVGPIEIERKNRQRIINVGGDLYGRALGEVTADLKAELKKLGRPPGISMELGGEVEEQEEAFRDLTLMLILGIVLVYMIMASLFGSLRDPFIIMFSIPFAFSGVIYIYYFSGANLGLLSFMGVIMLMGIVVNNAIVLINYILLLRKRGLALMEAVTEAGRSRLRPVLMTTFTTFFAMLPVATSNKVGSEAWKALGVTMLGGLSVSTLITLVLVPTLYYMLERRKTGV